MFQILIQYVPLLKGEIMLNTYTNISNELRSYFSSHSIFKILIPLDVVLILGGLAILILSNIFLIGFGGLITTLAYWLFILGLLLAYANLHQQFLYIGLLAYGASELLLFILKIFRSRPFGWENLIPCLIFGGLGYLVFKRCNTSGSSQTGVSS